MDYLEMQLELPLPLDSYDLLADDFIRDEHGPARRTLATPVSSVLDHLSLDDISPISETTTTTTKRDFFWNDELFLHHTVADDDTTTTTTTNCAAVTSTSAAASTDFLNTLLRADLKQPPVRPVVQPVTPPLDGSAVFSDAAETFFLHETVPGSSATATAADVLPILVSDCNELNALGQDLNADIMFMDPLAPAPTPADSNGASAPKQRKRKRRSDPELSSSSSSSESDASETSRKCSDARLSAIGLAKKLNLSTPQEALERERYILDIFQNELKYPLGYKTWIRDTDKKTRKYLIEELHSRVRGRYPEYDVNILETIIRRATYSMMQSRLRRERRAKIKKKTAAC